MTQFATAVRRTGLSVLVALAMITGLAMFAGAATAAPASAERAVVGKSTAGKVTSTVVGRTSAGDKVTGKFTPIRAVDRNGVLSMKGFLEGVITNDAGKKTKFSGVKVIPIKKIAGTSLADARSVNRAAACQILRLVLGPLDLNILGLRIQLNQVILNITAEPGPGNLLGNLLCAVAGLLDGGPLAGLLGQLRGLLNQILGLLNFGV